MRRTKGIMLATTIIIGGTLTGCAQNPESFQPSSSQQPNSTQKQNTNAEPLENSSSDTSEPTLRLTQFVRINSNSVTDGQATCSAWPCFEHYMGAYANLEIISQDVAQVDEGANQKAIFTEKSWVSRIFKDEDVTLTLMLDTYIGNRSIGPIPVVLITKSDEENIFSTEIQLGDVVAGPIKITDDSTLGVGALFTYNQKTDSKIAGAAFKVVKNIARTVAPGGGVTELLLRSKSNEIRDRIDTELSSLLSEEYKDNVSDKKFLSRFSGRPEFSVKLLLREEQDPDNELQSVGVWRARLSDPRVSVFSPVIYEKPAEKAIPDNDTGTLLATYRDEQKKAKNALKELAKLTIVANTAKANLDKKPDDRALKSAYQTAEKERLAAAGYLDEVTRQYEVAKKNWEDEVKKHLQVNLANIVESRNDSVKKAYADLKYPSVLNYTVTQTDQSIREIIEGHDSFLVRFAAAGKVAKAEHRADLESFCDMVEEALAAKSVDLTTADRAAVTWAYWHLMNDGPTQQVAFISEPNSANVPATLTCKTHLDEMRRVGLVE